MRLTRAKRSSTRPQRTTFLRCRDGASAVEFAMVAPIFFGFFFILFELGLMMLRVSSADDAVSQVSRLIYTGAATNGTVTVDDIENFICDRVSFVEDCKKNIMVDSRVIQTFADRPDTEAPCRDSSQPNYTPAATYNTGQQSEIVFLRVCLTTDPILPGYGLAPYLADTVDGRVQIIASMAFANEPF